ncbi:solute carrier family 25 (mitochondrial dicarboxylate transporter), member 10 [Sporothrix brasiliensis 5110]|uniref:Solute carrier family 25 (Mitochondrial dicarboxylate transporter), member 10 n=1 Tax=Sporothrix brasiliensis 5110 TaxID=1398154 RepID=A0A0C2FUQ5_9PEZI|nr:solute carrier family 25 (mitochondrial dicarboxylate transporter), member 10 [Sporothrix brasiliensis 5110]KIH94738.1 solute carrier family 25 (mitochondrial dicarboxylate transporter), member 10 [Sporothrix brasiliensis 5110]
MASHKTSAPATPAVKSAPSVVSATATSKKPASKSIHYPFWFGGSASSLAACVTHPMDLVKVRLQMRHGDMPRTMSGTFAHIVRTEGIRGLYSGLSASLLRQLTYSTTRFGLYEAIKGRLEEYAAGKPDAGRKKKKAQVSFGALVVAASVAGMAGGFAGNAADVLNVRMQHDAALPVEKRRGYRNAVHGLVRLAREEGLAKGWFRGVWPNSIRAAAMTASQLASYDSAKRVLLATTPLTDSLAAHLIASFLAGVAAATVTSPIDVIKTRVMSSHGAKLTTVLGELYATEGLRWMFKGWVPSFIRLGPHTIFTFVFLEAHRKLYRKMKSLPDPQ